MGFYTHVLQSGPDVYYSAIFTEVIGTLVKQIQYMGRCSRYRVRTDRTDKTLVRLNREWPQ